MESTPLRINVSAAGGQPGARGTAPVAHLRRAPATEDARAVSPEALRAAAESLNRYLRHAEVNLSFHVDDTTGRTVVRVVDNATGAVIRQVPSAETLAIARALVARRAAVLIDASA